VIGKGRTSKKPWTQDNSLSSQFFVALMNEK